jgi:hypothetical protein
MVSTAHSTAVRHNFMHHFHKYIYYFLNEKTCKLAAKLCYGKLQGLPPGEIITRDIWWLTFAFNCNREAESEGSMCSSTR